MGYSIKESKVEEGKIMRVLKMHAEGQKISTISENTELAYSTVKGLVEEQSNKAFIDDFRKQYMARVMEVPIANKRVRLDDLEIARKRLLEILEGLGKEERSKDGFYV